MNPLTIEQLKQNPFEQFSVWFDQAKKAPGILYPDAFCLSTIDEDGYPNGRMLLLKEHNSSGFTFFTNEESTKGKALLATCRGSMTFYWDPLRRQVRIQGDVSPLSDRESDEYFATRSRDSQAGAWASSQSRPLDDRAAFDSKVQAVLDEHEGREIARPPYWRGFFLRPRRIEFWQERPARLHDRFEYLSTSDGQWEIRRLYP